MAVHSQKGADKYNEVLGSIDGVLAGLNSVPEDLSTGADIPASPFTLLLAILKKIGVTEDDLINWLSWIIKAGLPPIELGIKGLLLSNMKKMISCTVDPRIPKKAREEGFFFDIPSIDQLGLLGGSPLDDRSNQLYFGYNKEKKNPHQLIRCWDFNAFLWYVMHYGKKPNPIKIDLDNPNHTDIERYFTFVYKAYSFNPKASSLESYITFQNTDADLGINEGTCFQAFKDGKPCSCISICSDRTDVEDEDTGITIRYYTIQPLTYDWNRTTYYINRATFGNNHVAAWMTDEDKNERDYNKDIGLLSVKYIGHENKDDSKNLKFKDSKNKINLRILPKGFLHIPRVGQETFTPVSITFDEEGNIASGGRFTLDFETQCNTPYDLELSKKIAERLIDGEIVPDNELSNNDPIWFYKLKKEDEDIVLAISKKGKYQITKQKIEADTEFNKLDSSQFLKPEEIRPYLKESYSQYTIYEFNYDYIMSLRLFDAKVIAANVMNTLRNFQMGIKIDAKYNTYGKSVRQVEMTETIVQIVKKIIEADDSASSDCFFTFSNDEYDAMSQKAELKRASLSPFGDTASEIPNNIDDVVEMLNEFGDAATLEESNQKLKNLLERTEAIVQKDGEYQERVISETKQGFDINCDIVMTTLNALLIELVSSLFTPKVMLAVLINAELCGQGALYNLSNLSGKEIVNQLKGIIENIVTEIKNMILEQLYEMVLSRLRKILALFAAQIVLEQVQAFARTMKLLLEACWFKSGGSGDSAFGNDKMTNVDYADIDEPEISDNKC